MVSAPKIVGEFRTLSRAFNFCPDFDRFDKHDPKLKEWRLPKEWDWCEARIKFAHEKADLMNYFNVPRYDVPELLRDPDDGKVWRDVWFDVRFRFFFVIKRIFDFFSFRYFIS